MLDEPEILDGSRSWAASQAVFRSAVDSTQAQLQTTASWYDTVLDEHEGAFALVRVGGPLEDWIGDVLEVRHEDRPAIYVYCIGGASLPTDFALCRYAYMQLSVLGDEETLVTVQPVL